MTLFLFGISAGEIVLIFLIVLMLFGSKKIPELARSIGRGMNEFRKATDEIKREFEQTAEDLKEDIAELSDEVHESRRELDNMADEVYDEIKTHKEDLEKNISDDTSSDNLNTSTSHTKTDDLKNKINR